MYGGGRYPTFAFVLYSGQYVQGSAASTEPRRTRRGELGGGYRVNRRPDNNLVVSLQWRFHAGVGGAQAP